MTAVDSGEPAPLALIEKRLRHPNADTRRAALLHAARQGEAAKSLARAVAWMLDDGVPAVEWHAARAFARVGVGAEDAVDVLIELASRDAPRELKGRALEALGVVGPAALAAIPMLKALSQSSGAFAVKALVTLARITPEDHDVASRIVEAVHSVDPRAQFEARQLLESASDAIVDHVLEDAHVRLASDTNRASAASVLSAVVRRRPREVADLLEPLFETDLARVAALTAALMPSESRAALAPALLRVADRHEGLRDLVASVLAPPAEVSQIDNHVDELPELTDDAPLEGRPQPLPSELVAQLVRAISFGAELTGVGVDDPPLALATAVDSFVKRARSSGRHLDDRETTALAVLWGKAVSQAGGWTWAQLVRDQGRVLCILSIDHAHATAPIAFIEAQRATTHDIAVLALFERIKANNLPASKPDALLFIDGTRD